MSTKLRVGVIGLGHWGVRAHLPALVAHEQVEVSIVVDPAPGAAAAVAAEFGVAQWAREPEPLWRDPSALDAVIIATPVDTHAEIASAALNAGLHVLCEKPLAYDVAEAADLARLAKATGHIAKMGFLFRHSPVIQKMKELVTDGFLGELQVFEGHTVNAQFIDPARPLHWKMTRARANGGVFAEYGSHAIDLALWFGGPMIRVVAHGVTLITNRPTPAGNRAPVDVDDTSAWIAEYATGAEASFRTSWASLPVGGGGIRLYGSRGSLAWCQDPSTRRREWLLAATIDEPEPHALLEFAPAFDGRFDVGPFPLGLLARYNRELVNGFIADILAGSNTGPSFDDGLRAQQVLAGIRTSLDERRWAELAPC